MDAWTILLERDGILAVDKPAFLSVIPGRNREDPCLQELVSQTLKQRIWVVHRLDRDTSGVLLFATTAERHRELSLAFEQHRVSKRYLCILEGHLLSEAHVRFPLVPARRSRMRVARPGEQGKDAYTHMRPLEHFKDATLAEAWPHTGRTHQIRVHVSAIGHPLLVDHQYGNQTGWGGVLRRTPLHAQKIKIDNLSRLGTLEIESRVPADIDQTLTALRQDADFSGSKTT